MKKQMPANILSGYAFAISKWEI